MSEERPTCDATATHFYQRECGYCGHELTAPERLPYAYPQRCDRSPGHEGPHHDPRGGYWTDDDGPGPTEEEQ